MLLAPTEIEIIHTTYWDEFQADFYQIKSNGYFQGRILKNGVEIKKTTAMMNESNAKRCFNNHIKTENLRYHAKLPEISYSVSQRKRELAEREKPTETITPTENVTPVTTVTEAVAESTPDITHDFTKTPPKPRKPARKPFTPYGLKGYFVDKNGNIRLHLDRRASARTIVLEPEMFAMLSEMVKATQNQGAQQC